MQIKKHVKNNNNYENFTIHHYSATPLCSTPARKCLVALSCLHIMYKISLYRRGNKFIATSVPTALI